MRVFLPLSFLILFSTNVFSQMSDYVKVKKRNNRTIKTFFTGSFISCKTVYGNYIGGVIQDIKNDSLFIKEFDVRSVPTQWGVSKTDTIGSFLIGLYYKDIQTVDIAKREPLALFTNGTLLMVGGLGYAALNVINGKYLNEPITSRENMQSLGISLGAAGVGYLLNRLRKFNRETGKKYRVEYVRMNQQLKPF